MSINVEVETGGELLPYLLRGRTGHPHMTTGRECFLCGKDCSKVALTKLAYVFEPCNCGTPNYEHLVECLQHRNGCT